MASTRSVNRTTHHAAGRLLAVSAVAIAVTYGVPGISPASRPGLAAVEKEFVNKIKRGAPPAEDSGFVTKVFSAAVQGATAAMVAAVLSACTEPIVNRLLVKRMTFGEAWKEINFKLVSGFFLTTFPTNMLKFPVFEVINMMLSFTSLSGPVRGIVNGWLFCTLMLPVTNYRFRKSMGWEVKLPLLYQAYIPTVSRDIVYGWARGYVANVISSSFTAESLVGKAFVFGVTIWAACIISSPGNEWRGYTLQPADRRLPFSVYFKPVNYARSTGIGATIMGIALMVGMLVTPYAEMLFGYLKENPVVAGVLVVASLAAVGVVKKKSG